MKTIMTLSVEVLIPDNTAEDKRIGVGNMAHELCEQAGRYLRGQLRKQVGMEMDVRIRVKENES